MNLATEPWIPVLQLNGKPDLASLQDVFMKGREYADFAVRPHERIALMRLLICIAQAVLDGPANIDEWDNAPQRLPDAAVRYLNDWEGSFNLFHPECPFLQIAKLVKPQGGKQSKNKKDNSRNPVSKLDFALASQNNSTLFDHGANSTSPRLFQPEWLALNLLTFQNFSSSGRIGIALWNGVESADEGASSASPCLKSLMLHTFVRRRSLLTTICANLLTKNQISKYLKPCEWGKPLWEEYPTSPNDQKAIANATKTYLGRLLPLSRWIKIDPRGIEMILANGFSFKSHPDFPAECSATEYVDKKTTARKLLSVSDKSIWRQLPAILVKYANNRQGRSPLCLENQDGNESYDIWVGGLSWNSKGGYLDMAESVLKIVPTLQTDAGWAAYEKEVLYAEKRGGQLRSAVREYRKHIDGELGKVDQEQNKKRKKDLEKKLQAIAMSAASRSFWTAVEKQRYLLMDYVSAISTTAEAVEITKGRWRKAVNRAIRDSYDLACGKENSRQMRAFAFGLAQLFKEFPPSDAIINSEPENIEE